MVLHNSTFILNINSFYSNPQNSTGGVLCQIATL